jgi:hypothetical protein
MGTSRVGAQLTTAFVLAVFGFAAPATEATSYAPAPRSIESLDAAQDWKRAILQFLAAFSDYLRCSAPQTDDVAAAIQEVQACYYTRGIPLGADLAQGRSIVESLYSQLKADPGVLDPSLQNQFAYDLRQAYAELGGNPLDL